MPSLTKLFETPTASFASRRIESQHTGRRCTIDRDYVPNLQWSDIDGQKINFLCRVEYFIAVCAPRPIDPFNQAENRFHLHSQETLAGIKDEVIAFAVSVRLSHAKTQARRLVQKCKFSQLAFFFSLERPAD